MVSDCHSKKIRIHAKKNALFWMSLDKTGCSRSAGIIRKYTYGIVLYKPAFLFKNKYVLAAPVHAEQGAVPALPPIAALLLFPNDI